MLEWSLLVTKETVVKQNATKLDDDRYVLEED